MKLKKISSLIFLISAITISCEKDDDVVVKQSSVLDEKDNDESVVPDNIEMVQFSPFVVLKSIDSVGFDPAKGCTSVNYPLKGDKQYELDVNNDQKIDFILSISHWVATNIPGGSSFILNPCKVFENRSVSLYCNHDSVGIASSFASSPLVTAKEFVLEDQIDSNKIWSDDPFNKLNSDETIFLLRRDVGRHAPNHDPDQQEFYIGFRLKSDKGYNYGWILVSASGNALVIKQYAMNKSHGNSIYAGQEKNIDD